MTSRFFLIIVLVSIAAAPAKGWQPEGITTPEIKAKAAIVIDAASGKSLFEKNPDKHLPPASTTKILTALLFARKVPPQQSVTASPLAASMPGCRLGMTPGEQFKQKDLMHAILLISANDASVAAAEAASGSVPKFVAEMNSEAKKIGAPNSHFTNPHGLQNPNHFSTARDLANIARTCMNSPQFREIVKQRRCKMPRSGNRPSQTLKNTDDLLWKLPGAEGIKTGWTRAAGLCFVGSAKRGNVRIITVLLHSPNWQRETAALMNYGFAVMGTSPIGSALSKTPVLSKHPVNQGAKSSKLQSSPGSESFELPDQDVSDSQADLVSNQEEVTPVSQAGEPGSPKRIGNSGGEGSVAGGGSTTSGLDRNSDNLEPTFSHNAPVSHLELQPKATHKQNSTRNNPLPDYRDTAPTHRTHFNWWWLFLLLLLLFRRKRNHSDQESKAILPFLSGGALEKRAVEILLPSAIKQPSNKLEKSTQEMPGEMRATQTNIKVPEIMRRTGRMWFETLIADSNRLLEPMILREVKAFLEAEPEALIPALCELLHSSNVKVQLSAAEILGPSAPALVEETLQSLLDSERPGSDNYEAAIRQLGSLDGDRFETQSLQILLRECSLSAALSLFNQHILSSAAAQELLRIINLARVEQEPSESTLKSDLLRAYCAGILLKHGKTDTDKMGACLHYLDEKSRAVVISEMMSEVDQDWTIDLLVQLCLSQKGASGMHELINCHPETVQRVIEVRRKNASDTEQIDLDSIDWLILGVGDEKKIRKLRDAGDPLAAEALRLSENHHPDISHLSSDAVCAALQIVSLRLGFTTFSQAEINDAFRKAAEESGDLADIQPEMLRLLAIDYRNPDVHKAVQFALHQEEGKHLLLEMLTIAEESNQIIEELAFWSGKCNAQTRMMVISALSRSKFPAAQAALAARSQDPDPLIKTAALRALRLRLLGDFEEQPELSSQEELLETIAIKEAA